MPSNTWTATKALSRPCAGESSASSARDEAQLDRERDRVALEDLARAAHGVDGVLARDRVLHLLEAHEPRGGEDRGSDQSTRSRREATREAKRFSRGIVRGKRRATSLTTRKAWLSMQHVARVGARAAGRVARRLGAVVRARERERRVREGPELEVVVRVGALLRARRARPRAAPGASTSRSRNAGTQRSVTAAMTPSAPSDDPRGAQQVAVRRASRSLPSARTSSTASTCAERFGSRVPVPCVPVASAPASDWASMSPRFGIASPRACSSRESACRRMPGLDAHEPGRASASSTRSSASSESSVPVGQRAGAERVPGAGDAHRAGAARRSPARARRASAAARSARARSAGSRTS